MELYACFLHGYSYLRPEEGFHHDVARPLPFFHRHQRFSVFSDKYPLKQVSRLVCQPCSLTGPRFGAHAVGSLAAILDDCSSILSFSLVRDGCIVRVWLTRLLNGQEIYKRWWTRIFIVANTDCAVESRSSN
jgi:hypothetical protein